MLPLLNVWNFFGKLRKKHQRVQKQTFRQVSKILKIFRKSSEVFGNLRKNRRMPQSAQNDLPAFLIFLKNFRKLSEVFGNLRKISETVAKYLKQPSSIFELFWIFGNCRKSSEIFAILQKKWENVGKFSKRSSNNFWKFSKIFGNLWKCSKVLGKLRKPSENFQMWSEVYRNF